MQRWLICLSLGWVFAGCGSTAAVQGAREQFLAANTAGAKEAAPFEYYASKAYLELARYVSEAGDHAQARAWARQSREYGLDAARLAAALEGVK